MKYLRHFSKKKITAASDQTIPVEAAVNVLKNVSFSKCLYKNQRIFLLYVINS